MATILTTKDLADQLETDPKTLRKFLRSQASPVTPVGQGNRYMIEGKTARSLKKAFVNWAEMHTRPTRVAS